MLTFSHHLGNGMSCSLCTQQTGYRQTGSNMMRYNGPFLKAVPFCSYKGDQWKWRDCYASSSVKKCHMWIERNTGTPLRLRRPLTTRSGSRDSWTDWSDSQDVPQIDTSLGPGGNGAQQAALGSALADLAASLRSDMTMEEEAKEASRRADDRMMYEPKERVFLVGAALKSQQKKAQDSNSIGYGIIESLEELGRLAETAGLEVVGYTYQLLDDPNPRTYVGTGKVGEIAKAIEETGAETVLFDDELSPGQMRNLERALGKGVRLCDRTALILDIFSQRAATREGKLQVELAQAEYQLPRLTRMWSHLERQSGGASGQVKGMGEKQIEVDRRLLRNQAAKLRRQIEEVRGHRKAYRDRRASAPIPVIALVGYTNAGKSSLLNTLTNAGVLAEDKLFATLDPTTRRVIMPGGQEILFSDTVGFIQKLPTQLVAAFRATLEEITDATLLLHVVDASHPSAAAQVDAVNKVLDQLEVRNIPSLTVWNKIDACANPEAVLSVAARRKETVCVSAIKPYGMDDLLDAILEKLQKAMMMIHMTVQIPYTQGDLVDEIYRSGVVLQEDFTEKGTVMHVNVPPHIAGKLESLQIVYNFDEKSLAMQVGEDDEI
jgi:GTP-binding protein HflX